MNQPLHTTNQRNPDASLRLQYPRYTPCFDEQRDKMKKSLALMPQMARMTGFLVCAISMG